MSRTATVACKIVVRWPCGYPRHGYSAQGTLGSNLNGRGVPSPNLQASPGSNHQHAPSVAVTCSGESAMAAEELQLSSSKADEALAMEAAPSPPEQAGELSQNLDAGRMDTGASFK